MKLSINGLTFAYSSETVLDEVSFTAEKGECVAILGTNGAGKSTMLKCIDRILRYEKGEIAIDGRSTANMKPTELAKKIGYVPQSLNFSDSTVFDSVLMGRKPYIRWDAEKKDIEIADKLIEKLGLSEYALRNVNELSGGERQKVAIARALAQQPEILLFDEPTSNLDIKNQMDAVRLIHAIAKENEITVVVTMHDLNLALRFADKFILMKDNRVYASGDTGIITEKNIAEVYGVSVSIAKVKGKTLVIPD